MKTAALAGGVGGAKLVDGLAKILAPQELTVIVNTGDDFEHLGLWICPDLDTVCYTLSGVANPITGWGRQGETWNTMQALEELGGPAWFRLGDRDLATHLERTRLIKQGICLSEVTHRFLKAWGISQTVLPMCDDPTPTWVLTDEGKLSFQTYFVLRQCQPQVKGILLDGAANSRPAPGVLESIRDAELIVVCPSNPWVSIDPILALPGIRDELTREPPHGRKTVAVSPIIQGKTVKGPAAKMFKEMGFEATALAVAGHYGATKQAGLLDGIILDRLDDSLVDQIEAREISALTSDTWMRSPPDRARLASEVLSFGQRLLLTQK